MHHTRIFRTPDGGLVHFEVQPGTNKPAGTIDIISPEIATCWAKEWKARVVLTHDHMEVQFRGPKGFEKAFTAFVRLLAEETMLAERPAGSGHTHIGVDTAGDVDWTAFAEWPRDKSVRPTYFEFIKRKQVSQAEFFSGPRPPAPDAPFGKVGGQQHEHLKRMVALINNGVIEAPSITDILKKGFF